MSKKKVTVTKVDLVDAVYERVGFSKRQALNFVDKVFDSMKGKICLGEKIKISGFGNFVVRQKKTRVGRNPKTGEEVPIAARRVLTFRPSQVLKDNLNKERNS